MTYLELTCVDNKCIYRRRIRTITFWSASNIASRGELLHPISNSMDLVCMLGKASTLCAHPLMCFVRFDVDINKDMCMDVRY